MRLPIQAPTIVRQVSVARMARGIDPSDCNIFKKAACAVAIGACGVICYASLGTACVQCLAAIGASDCIDCF